MLRTYLVTKKRRETGDGTDTPVLVRSHLASSAQSTGVIWSLKERRRQQQQTADRPEDMGLGKSRNSRGRNPPTALQRTSVSTLSPPRDFDTSLSGADKSWPRSLTICTILSQRILGRGARPFCKPLYAVPSLPSIRAPWHLLETPPISRFTLSGSLSSLFQVSPVRSRLCSGRSTPGKHSQAWKIPYHTTPSI